jgi:hypothetical protein
MQGWFAEKAGGSPTTVSGIESGRILRPHFGAVKKLAWASGVDTGVAPALEGTGCAGHRSRSDGRCTRRRRSSKRALKGLARRSLVPLPVARREA